jgi:hypothetical protein
MIFKKFEETDIVAGRTTRVASGMWTDGATNLLQSNMVDDFSSLVTEDATSPSYGTSYYDVRRTMYYLNVYPNTTEYNNNNPYFSITYGNYYGNLGSGSFNTETGSIKTYSSKAIYTQYQNLLLGSSDVDGMFTMRSGSTTVNADDIWIISFSPYKMKDKLDEGVLQLSFSGSNGVVTLIDDSYLTNKNQSSYQLFAGELSSLPSTATYKGYGILYPQTGIIVLNAKVLAEELGLWDSSTKTKTGETIAETYVYEPYSSTLEYNQNHKTLFESMKLCNESYFIARKSEYVPARHYFVRIKNREFNYSNNPTYVYDGTDGIHSKGTILHDDFIDNPRTYITSIGLYDDNNELVAVAKFSRPAVKTFDNEILAKIKLDF